MDNPAANDPPSSTASAPTRSMWTAIIILAATMTAFVAGVLAWAGGANIPTSVLTGGGAFAGAVALLLALLNFSSGRSS